MIRHTPHILTHIILLYAIIGILIPCRASTMIQQPLPDIIPEEETVTSDSIATYRDLEVPQGVALVSGTLIEQEAKAMLRDPDRNWFHLLKKGELNMQDTTVQYPKFLKFCVAVYNWGDHTFNSYDTTYVVGTGRRWKTRVAFDGWTDSYNINLDHKLPITLISDPYLNASVNLQYMAVGISYGIDLNNLYFSKPVKHQKFEFNFNCARFNLDLAFNRNAGGTYVRTFGDFPRKQFYKSYFPGLDMTSFTGDIYYFFNNYKYANGAAYNFSKIQKKSAGSFMIGLSYAYEDISFDFNSLPEELVPYYTFDEKLLRFHYNSYCLLFGYGYNWVLNKYLLYNISVMPSTGVIRCYEDSSDSKDSMFSLNVKGRMSLTYNLRDFFTCLIFKADGRWYKTGRLSAFNAIENFSLSVGVRF